MPESRLDDIGRKKREDGGVNCCGEEEKRLPGDVKLSRCSRDSKKGESVRKCDVRQLVGVKYVVN